MGVRRLFKEGGGGIAPGRFEQTVPKVTRLKKNSFIMARWVWVSAIGLIILDPCVWCDIRAVGHMGVLVEDRWKLRGYFSYSLLQAISQMKACRSISFD